MRVEPATSLDTSRNVSVKKFDIFCHIDAAIPLGKLGRPTHSGDTLMGMMILLLSKSVWINQLTSTPARRMSL